MYLVFRVLYCSAGAVYLDSPKQQVITLGAAKVGARCTILGSFRSSRNPTRKFRIHESVETVLHFLDLINRRDADKLAELMTEGHVFIDSLGHSVQGREKMRAGWRGYYAMCPDYWVSHEEILQNGNIVAVFGSAGGTIAVNGKLPPENKWRASSAWLAVVDKGLLKEWRVYADNKSVYDILAKCTPHQPQ